MNDLLSLADLDAGELTAILDAADELKHTRRWHGTAQPLAGKSVALVFSKSSTRTRVSFEVGIYELGGNPMYFDKNSLQLGRGEPIADTARVLSRYVHGIVIRYHEHADVVELAAAASVPVINALTDRFHPCQIVADLQTIRENRGQLAGVKVAFVGDAACNTAATWVQAVSLAGLELRLGAPPGYQPDPELLAQVRGPGRVLVTADPAEAVAGADVVYTDVWVSMGFETETEARRRDLQRYQINAALLARAAPHAKVMHCLPAHRGEEITGDVLDGPQSIVWDQAENRLHTQKAVLARLLGTGA